MEKLSKGLATVDERVVELKHNFELHMKEATQIKIDLDKQQASFMIFVLQPFSKTIYNEVIKCNILRS